MNELLQHKCGQCDKYVCIFSPSLPNKVPAKRSQEYRNRQKAETKKSDTFPPPPVSSDLIEDIVQGFSTDISDFHESACAVCAQLIPQKLLLSITKEDYNQDLLMSDNVVTMKG